MSLKHFSTKFFGKTLPSVLAGFALIFSANHVQAQTVEKKAQDAVGSYLVIIAISKMCGFNVAKPVKDAVGSNIDALKVKAKMKDAELDQTLGQSIKELGKNKEKFCGPGQAQFDKLIPVFASQASEAAAGLGVALAPVPANFASSAPEVAAPAAAPPVQGAAFAVSEKERDAFRNLLISAHMLEAVSDQCKITLTNKEVLNLDRVQYYFRGRGNFSVGDVKQIVDTVEKQVTDNKATVCSPKWPFKDTLATMLEMIK